MVGQILLYVGCGHHRMEGFIHLEINPGKRYKGGGCVSAPDILADISEKIPLPDDSCRIIFSRGTLEHLTYQELVNHLLDAHRLLVKGGAVRMVVPNFDSAITDYHNKVFTPGDGVEMSRIMPHENHVDQFICKMLYHDHYYLHNYDTLFRILDNTGFSNIRECNPGDTIIEECKNELYKAEDGRLPSHIIMEAQKLDVKPSLSRYERKYSSHTILRLLQKYLNITIKPFIKRRPMFPQRLWFEEKGLYFNSKKS